MSVLSRFQLNAIVRAGLIASSGYWPSMTIGQNMPLDVSYGTMPTFNDRMMATVMGGEPVYNAGFTATLDPALQDPTTGVPTVGFSVRIVDGVAANDPTLQGTWFVKYTAAAQRGVTAGAASTIQSSTFSAGVGKVTFTYAGTSAIVLAFDGPLTSPPQVYSPANSAAAIAGTAVPFWNPAYLQSVGAFGYVRFMDVCNANSDYVDPSTHTWPLVNEWAGRCTPSVYMSTSMPGGNRGYPLEWQLDLCAKTGKPGWFNVPTLASDDYITQFTTMIATSQSAGTQAMFECVGNERWNFAAGFHTYHKTGAAALAETLYGTSVQIFYGHTQRVVGVTFDGTNATVQFLNPHGLSVGVSANKIAVFGALAPYTGMNTAAASNTGFTVIDANNVSFACTVAASGGQIAGTTIFGSTSSGVGGGVALNAGSNLFTYSLATGAYNLGNAWFFRRSQQAAALVRAAWTAAGRSLADCNTIFPLQAGSTWPSLLAAQNFVTGITGQPLSTSFTSSCVGGYFTTALNGSGMNAGFGFSQGVNTPVTSSDVLSQLRTFVDHSYGAYCYGAFATWCGLNGLSMLCYESGVDTSTVGSQGTAGATAANADPLMEGITRDWLYGLAQLGFKGAGWYQCGAGTYAGVGCFNVGQTAAEANYLSGSPSPKLKGIVDALTPPTTLPVTRHAFPCTLSGYDCVGNEAVVTVANAWPSFGLQNLSNTANIANGPNQNGLVYEVWSEISRTATVTLVGHTLGGSAITVTVQGSASPSTTTSFNAAAAVGSASVGVTLGTATVQLQPGPNWVQLTVPNASRFNCSPHSVQFS